MAARYWVGGTGNWDNSTTTHWSTSSGGSGGASVPGSSDDVILDASSGGGTVSLTVTPVTVKSITAGLFTGTLDLSGGSVLSCGTFSITTGGGGSSLSVVMGALSLFLTGTGTVFDGTFPSANSFNPGTSTVFVTEGSTAAKAIVTANILNNLAFSGFGNFSATGNGGIGGTFTFSGLGSGAVTLNSKLSGPSGLASITNTGVGASINFGSSTSSIAGIIFTGFVGTWAGSGTLQVSASLTLCSTMLITYTGNLSLSGTCVFTTAGLSLASAVTIASGTCTLIGNLTTTSTLTLTSGTFDAAGYDVTATSFASSNSNTRTLKLGAGTWTLTSTGTIWNCATTTGLTVTPGTSTIKFTDSSSSSKTFSGGGKTYYNIWLTGTGTGTFDFVGSNTFNGLKVDNPPHTLRFTGSTTTTVTTYTGNGASGSLMSLVSISGTFTIAKTGGGTITGLYLSITNSTASPTVTFYAVNSTDGGGNTNWTFSVAPTVTRIFFNSHWLDLPYLYYTIQDSPQYSNLRNKSASGKVETLSINIDDLVSLSWRWFVNANAANATTKRLLRQWFLWAQVGGDWQIALDSSETVLTVLLNATAVGDTSIVVSSPSGISVNKQYVIRNASRFDLVLVTNIAGSTLTLNFAYSAGDRFRSEQYWPARLTNNANPVVEKPPLHYDFDLQFMEDVNGL